MLDTVRSELVNAYYDNTAMLETCLNVVGFFEEVANIFPYPNWIEGEVVAGPSVKRYWVTIVLKYDYKKMPDPDGGLVLTRLGCKVLYKKFKQIVEVEVKSSSDLGERNRPKTTTEPCWLIKIVIPKHFLDDKKLKDLALIADEFDPDQIEDSLNKGLETSGVVNDQEDNEDQQPEAANNIQGG